MCRFQNLLVIGSRDASYDDFLEQLKVGEGKQCRYGVYDYEYTYRHQGTASVKKINKIKESKALRS